MGYRFHHPSNEVIPTVAGSNLVYKDKNIVWSHTVAGSVYEARRLRNGNTLISDPAGVYIVDRAGKVVWEKKMSGVGRAIRF